MSKFNRESFEYVLAERIVHAEEALKRANEELKRFGKLGVSQNIGVTLRESATFHKKVRDLLKKEGMWNTLKDCGLDEKLKSWK